VRGKKMVYFKCLDFPCGLLEDSIQLSVEFRILNTHPLPILLLPIFLCFPLLYVVLLLFFKCFLICLLKLK
jgi:hypothetical protein